MSTKMKTYLIVLTFLFLIILILSPSLYKNDLVNINDYDSVVNSIVKLKGYSSVEIVKAEKYNNYYAVIYKPTPSLDNSKENLELSIYRRTNSSLLNNYEYYGGASSSKNFNTFNGNEKGKETLIIAYGDNHSMKAGSYSIKSSQNTYKKDIELDYILDIYVLLDTNNCSSFNELYDESGTIIDIF